MQELQFKEGDCVQIKHGDNPNVMNVNMVKTIPLTNRIEIWCKWFNSKEQRWEDESFSPEVLMFCKQGDEQN